MLAAGGTGGHVYPALAAAEVLQTQAIAHELVFVGTQGGFERPLVEAAGVRFAAYHEVWAGPLNGVGVLTALVSLLKLAIGTLQAFALLLRHRPHAVLLTGGWANVPLAVAGWLLRAPMLVYLPDIEPALTVSVVARFARRVAVTVDDSRAFFKGSKTVTTGYPLRRSVREATRAAGRAHFGLDNDRPVLLVFGGSRGARSLNLALESCLAELLADGVQVLHLTGTLDWERSQTATQAQRDARDYHAFPYLHDDMGLALAAADVVLCRSGASTLGELPYFGLAGILVPYPHAWRYQKVNADYLVARGAALRLEDETLDKKLLPTLRELLANRVQLAQMQASARQLARDGAAALAAELLTLAGAKHD